MAEAKEAGSVPEDNSATKAVKVPRVLPAAARRALAEAAARRAATAHVEMETERGGRADGPEPTRYGDWENKGIISDF